MKKIYFVQANAVYGDTVKSTYIPYAAGCIVSYAFSHEKIREEYTFERFIYTREDIKQAAASIEGPCIIGFSSSIWNNEYNKALARAIKEKIRALANVSRMRCTISRPAIVQKMRKSKPLKP